MHDELDLEMLRTLRTNGRISISKLAQRIHISRANAYARIDRLLEDKVLLGYTARVDVRRLGLGVGAVILISGRQAGWRELQGAVSDYGEIEYFAYITGNYDALLIVRVPDLETLRDVVLERLQALKEISRTHTLFLLDEPIRRPYVLPDEGARHPG